MDFSLEISRITDLVHTGQLDLANQHARDTPGIDNPRAVAVIVRCTAILDDPAQETGATAAPSTSRTAASRNSSHGECLSSPFRPPRPLASAGIGRIAS